MAQQELEFLAARERRHEGNEGVLSGRRRAIRADKPHRIKDLVAPDGEQEITRLLERPNDHVMPQVHCADNVGEGGADPAVTIVQEPRGASQGFSPGPQVTRWP